MADEQKQTTKKTRPSKPKSAYALALEHIQAEHIAPTAEQQPIQTENHSDAQQSEHSNSKPEKQPEVKTSKQQPIQTKKQETIQPMKQPDTQTVNHTNNKPEKQQRTKGTYYLDMEDIIAIDTIQTQRYRATGKKPEKSELVSEAIQLLFKQENS
jgi:hypothetical protein